MATAGRKKKDQIKVIIRRFRTFSDYHACVEIQREVWRFEDVDLVPAALLRVTEEYGGILLGAYSAIGEMIGFVCSLLAMEDGSLLQHSHMLAVRSAYREFNVGFRLKEAQRAEALRRKIRRITWTFDPMQPLNAYFNFGKLGAWSGSYREDYYGDSSSFLHRGLPTDRFVATWDLSSPAVKERLSKGSPKRDLRKELPEYKCINTLAEVVPGMAASSPVKLNCTASEFLFEIPYNLPDIRIRDRAVALEWQSRMRQVFQHYFKKGYIAADFWMGDEDGHPRAFYYLTKKKPS